MKVTISEDVEEETAGFSANDSASESSHESAVTITFWTRHSGRVRVAIGRFRESA